MTIGKLIKAWRNTNRIGIRETARSIGISAATLSRIERGKACDATVMLQIINWLFS